MHDFFPISSSGKKLEEKVVRCVVTNPAIVLPMQFHLFDITSNDVIFVKDNLIASSFHNFLQFFASEKLCPAKVIEVALKVKHMTDSFR